MLLELVMVMCLTHVITTRCGIIGVVILGVVKRLLTASPLKEAPLPAFVLSSLNFKLNTSIHLNTT